MKLILVRHGETEENKHGIHQGQLPGRLSDDGKVQAKKVGERLKSVHIDIIYSSDLQRCIDTTQEIAKHHPTAKIIHDKRLRERSLGEFEGKKKGEADWSKLSGDELTNRPKGGEAFTDLFSRVKEFVDELLKKKIDQTILISTHGGPLKMIHGILTGKNLRESFDIENQKNTSVSEYLVD